MALKARISASVVIVLVLVFNLVGCAQTQPVLQESGAAVKQNEKMEQVDPKGSGQSTDWGVYMDEEGAM